MSTESKCPFNHGQFTGSGRTNRDWWPNQLDLRILHQHTAESNPMGEDFDYATYGLAQRRHLPHW